MAARSPGLAPAMPPGHVATPWSLPHVLPLPRGPLAEGEGSVLFQVWLQRGPAGYLWGTCYPLGLGLPNPPGICPSEGILFTASRLASSTGSGAYRLCNIYLASQQLDGKAPGCVVESFETHRRATWGEAFRPHTADGVGGPDIGNMYVSKDFKRLKCLPCPLWVIAQIPQVLAHILRDATTRKESPSSPSSACLAQHTQPDKA